MVVEYYWRKHAVIAEIVYNYPLFVRMLYFVYFSFSSCCSSSFTPGSIPKRSLNARCTLTTDSLVFTNASYANTRQTTLYCAIVTIKSYYLTYRMSLSRPIPTYIQRWKNPVYYFPIPPSIYVIITFLLYFILAIFIPCDIWVSR